MLFRSVLLCLAIAGWGVTPAHAEWTNGQRTTFMNDCVPGCQNNPNVHPSRRGECTNFCRCFAQEAESLPVDYPTLERELAGAIETVNVRRFKAIGPTCNQRVFGN